MGGVARPLASSLLHVPTPPPPPPPPPTHTPPSLGAGLNATYSFEPLSNLVYTRDQQITTCKGIVMGRLRSPQRNLEVSLMKFCLQKLGEPSLQPGLAWPGLA